MPKGYPGSSPKRACARCGALFTAGPRSDQRLCSKQCADAAMKGCRTALPCCRDCGKALNPGVRKRSKVRPVRCWSCHLASLPGKTPNADGYIVIRIGGKQILEHRYVMEQVIGRPLAPGEVVHHKNEIVDDNRPENLELCESAGQHVADHHREALRQGARNRRPK